MELGDRSDLAARQDQQPFDVVLELAEIAGPVMRPEAFDQRSIDTRQAFPQSCRPGAKESLEQDENIPVTAAKRRQADRRDIYQIVEFPGQDTACHVCIGIADHRHNHARALALAQELCQMALQKGIHLMQRPHEQRVLRIGLALQFGPQAVYGGSRAVDGVKFARQFGKLVNRACAEFLAGGDKESLDDSINGGYYIQPTVFKGHNKMRVFQEEIFGPVISVTTFKDEAEALEIANDTEFGLGAGVWTRDMNRAYRMGRGIQAGRVWTNCYHAYPAHAAFGGYKKSGIGRETHKVALEHYQQTKNLLVSYATSPLGFF